MDFTLNINMDNSAFTESPGQELARILRAIADNVEGYSFSLQCSRVQYPVRDINGNKCGAYSYSVDFEREE